MVAVSKGTWAVKLCINKILQFSTGGAGWRRLTCIMAVTRWLLWLLVSQSRHFYCTLQLTQQYDFQYCSTDNWLFCREYNKHSRPSAVTRGRDSTWQLRRTACRPTPSVSYALPPPCRRPQWPKPQRHRGDGSSRHLHEPTPPSVF